MNLFLMNRILACFFLLSFSMSSLNAQIGGPVASRSNKQNRSHTVENSTTVYRKLAARITENTTGELEKARAIFNWIATHISYDNELRHDTRLQKQFYTSEKNVISKVLERRKALCGGYAFLFKELCKQVGLQSEVVHGFSKKYYSQARVTKKPDHTWNSVKINGTFYLLDLTLAVSQGQGSKPNMSWFCTNPDFFIKTHYPEDKKWALIPNPLSRTEFERLPIQNP
jgi:transglutaminase/protease-like cytokinesis protein 3